MSSVSPVARPSNAFRARLIGPTEVTQPFLDAYKPSSNSSTGLGGWYWVNIPKKKDTLTNECQRISQEAPVRGNKKEGIKSQKEQREEEHAVFNEQVKALAQEHHITSGKWLFFPAPEAVDATWAKIVNSVARPDGALAKTGVVHCAKVASELQAGAHGYVICVYCDDSWDKAGVGAAFRTLVKDLGLISTAYKTDANTILGIDSKHPSKIKSSLYGKNDFMTKDEIDVAMAERAKAAEANTKAKAVKKKTLEEEEAEGGGFAPDSDDDEPPKKKVKA